MATRSRVRCVHSTLRRVCSQFRGHLLYDDHSRHQLLRLALPLYPTTSKVICRQAIDPTLRHRNERRFDSPITELGVTQPRIYLCMNRPLDDDDAKVFGQEAPCLWEKMPRMIHRRMQARKDTVCITITVPLMPWCGWIWNDLKLLGRSKDDASTCNKEDYTGAEKTSAVCALDGWLIGLLVD
jgi:hypothetical protein